MYLLGYDIGSSSIKAALVEVESGQQIAVTQQPKVEMDMTAGQPGWAEQHPDDWWKYLCLATKELLSTTAIDAADIKGIGIAYQMHGLVMVDKKGIPLRPSIIWCDSRAVTIGDQAFSEIGEKVCLTHLLNSPGNFTASKLKWVQRNEPDLYETCHKIMLPGDYIAYKLTGEINTTISGLSEGILWDFREQKVADIVLDHYHIRADILPDIVPTFSEQGRLSQEASRETGLAVGTPITYRAGDQPNNALSLNVLNPGEVAATGGTSGVVYGVVEKPLYDPKSRVNGFAHVNYRRERPVHGILLCINGAGIQYGWVRNQLAPRNTAYKTMESAASKVPVGADGLLVIPFGNGAERMLSNQHTGAQFANLQLNRHTKAHLYRATLEGIAFSFVYGMSILEEMGLSISVIRVGNDNLFQSKIFSETISTMTSTEIEMMQTTGAIGAALASGVQAKVYEDLDAALGQLSLENTTSPQKNVEPYLDAYERWTVVLKKNL